MKNPTLHIPLTEILKSIPEIFGVRLNEEPKYKVAEKHGTIERRLYSAQRVARLTIGAPADFDQYRQEAFRRLANYIFGGNRLKKQISMTAPVLQEPVSINIPMTAPVLHDQDKKGWTMSFVLPAKYVQEEPPAPVDPEIRLELVPPYETAVISYSGNNTLKRMREHETKLRSWINSQNDLRADGEAFFAQYDAPFVLPFLKRNEVQLKVAAQKN